MDKDTFIGNLTTILKILIMTIAPPIAVYLGLDQQIVLSFLTACMTFTIAILDAKFFNTWFNKNNEPTITVNVQPNELEKAIQEAKQETTQNETTDEEEDVEDDQQ